MSRDLTGSPEEQLERGLGRMYCFAFDSWESGDADNARHRGALDSCTQQTASLFKDGSEVWFLEFDAPSNDSLQSRWRKSEVSLDQGDGRKTVVGRSSSRHGIRFDDRSSRSSLLHKSLCVVSIVSSRASAMSVVRTLRDLFCTSMHSHFKGCHFLAFGRYPHR